MLSDLFYEVFASPPRSGPGNFDSTKKAFEMIKNLPEKPEIIDIGCGPGVQSMHLASLTDGKILALDNYQPFLDRLNKNAAAAGLSQQIECRIGDMMSLDFADNTFDLIWSEGAIYIIGFEKGLLEWRRILKPGGYIAVTDMVWLKSDSPPAELRKFIDEECPETTDIRTNLETMEKAGYENTGHFILPSEAFRDEYYVPLQKVINEKREKYKDDKEALKFLEQAQLEVDLYEKYSEFYGYAFYIARKKTE